MKLDNVVRSIAFGPIFDITQFVDKKGKYWKNILNYFSEFNDNSRKKYFNLIPLIKTQKFNFFYFYANNNNLDTQQHCLLIKNKIFLDCVGIDSKTHCGIFNQKINIFLLTCSEKKFESFKKKFAERNFIQEKEILDFTSNKLNLLSKFWFLKKHFFNKNL